MALALVTESHHLDEPGTETFHQLLRTAELDDLSRIKHSDLVVVHECLKAVRDGDGCTVEVASDHLSCDTELLSDAWVGDPSLTNDTHPYVHATLTKMFTGSGNSSDNTIAHGCFESAVAGLLGFAKCPKLECQDAHDNVLQSCRPWRFAFSRLWAQLVLYLRLKKPWSHWKKVFQPSG